MRPPPPPTIAGSRAPRWLALVLVALLVLAASCSNDGGTGGSTGSRAPARPKVIVSTDIVGAVTTQLLGDQADVTVLMPPGTDPATFVPSPEQAQAMQRADVIVTVGLGLEAGMRPALDDARKAAVTVLELGPQLGPLPIDRNAGTAASAAQDPRIWLDPDRMTHGARIIADLVETRPGVDKAKVEAQHAALAALIATADEDVQAALAPIAPERRALVTVGGPIGYLADRYGFEVVDQGLAGSRPIAGIVTDPHAPDDATSDVARRAGADTPIITLDLASFGAAGSGADTYPALLVANAQRLGRALTAPEPTTTTGVDPLATVPG